MKPILMFSKTATGSLGAAALLCLPALTRGATVTLSVDPTQSSLTLSGGLTVSGSWPFSQQVAGSLVDALGGTITATVTGSGLSFSGGSSIQALLNPNSVGSGFRPNNAGGDPFGAPWSGMDNFGTLSLPFGNPWFDAYRDLQLDINTGTASAGGDPASAMSLFFISGHNDMSGPAFGLGLSQPLASWPVKGGANGSGGNVTWDGSTLTIPVKLVTESFNANGLIIDETWNGQIVAVVPEPSSLALVGLGLAAFGLAKARRGRRG